MAKDLWITNQMCLKARFLLLRFRWAALKTIFLGSRPLNVDFKVTNSTGHYTGYYRHSYDLKRDKPLAIAKQLELADLTFEPLYKIILQVSIIMPGAPESPTKEQLEKVKQTQEQRKVKTDEQETPN